jgi:hypothetical protein
MLTPSQGQGNASPRMRSHYVPSPSLLWHLARLTRPSLSLRSTLSLQQQRHLSRSDNCSVQRSTYARSPRTRAAAKKIGASFAAANYKDIRSLTQFLDVLDSKWVMRDFAVLDLSQPEREKMPPQAYVVDVFLDAMKNGLSPGRIADWFSGTNPRVSAAGLGECGDLQRHATKLIQLCQTSNTT